MRILSLHKQILFPRDTGGKIRVLNIVEQLARRHDMTFLCNLRDGEEAYLEQMQALGMRLETVPMRQSRRGSWRYGRDLALNLLSPYPFTVSRNYEAPLRARAAALVREVPYDLLICDTVVMARHVTDLAVPARILFQRNVEAQLLQRHAQTSAGWLRRRYMALQWRRMRRFEGACGRSFDAVIAVSEADRQTFAREYGWRHVRAIDTGVDVHYFKPGETGEQPGRVLFVGSLDWLPNQEGVDFFVHQVWPAVLRAHPAATFQIVGRNPAGGMRRLARLEGVQVVGTVPDVRPYLSAAQVVVVPLLVGGGTRIKIFEAMAMGKAVVSTTIGAEGLDVEPDKHIVLADSAADLAQAVSGLLDDGAKRRRIGQVAQGLVTEHYSTETVGRQFEQICEETVEQARLAAPAQADPAPQGRP
ncbi:MAG TPA: glycosyltransferase [Gemmataceae bacterium]|jgi:glycosyltransferase involved in cell wall biosynthesis|nr:glycosyltransferase [Gemmataceae bacterium]